MPDTDEIKRIIEGINMKARNMENALIEEFEEQLELVFNEFKENLIGTIGSLNTSMGDFAKIVTASDERISEIAATAESDILQLTANISSFDEKVINANKVLLEDFQKKIFEYNELNLSAMESFKKELTTLSEDTITEMNNMLENQRNDNEKQRQVFDKVQSKKNLALMTLGLLNTVIALVVLFVLVLVK